MMQVVGIDIGGTEIKAALVDNTGKLTEKVIVRTPVQDGADGILHSIYEIMNHYSNNYTGITSVGIGSAGRINPRTGHVIYATENLPGWTGVHIKEEIKKRYDVKVKVDNDVNVAAIGEKWQGAARYVDQFVLLTIGTGIGGAFVYNGHVVHGPTGSASEIGHMIIHPNGKSCNCGQSGCLEQYISGSALNDQVKSKMPDWNTYVLLEQYKKKHPIAVELMDTFMFHLTIGLINIHHFYDPELIIVGGGFGDTFNQWKPQLDNIIPQHTERNIRTKQAVLGNEAGIIGAAYLAMAD